MNNTLLAQFISEECTPYVRDLVRAALAEVRSGTAPPTKRFEFNRFELTIDAEDGVALLEDVLDAGAGGTQSVSLQELETRLQMLTEKQAN
jgi:hypothetical protein